MMLGDACMPGRLNVHTSWHLVLFRGRVCRENMEIVTNVFRQQKIGYSKSYLYEKK